MRAIVGAALVLALVEDRASAEPPKMPPELQRRLDAAVRAIGGRWIVPSGSAEGANPGTWGEITTTPTYFVWTRDKGIDRVPKSGGTTIHSDTNHYTYAADATSLYYAEVTGRCDDPDHCNLVHWLYTVPLAGGAKRLVSKSPNAVKGLWSDDRFLYVHEELFDYAKPGERFVRHRLRDGKREVVPAKDAVEPARIPEDDNDFVYRVERPGDPVLTAAKYVVRIAKRGGARTVLATQSRDFYRVYVYGNWLYWSSSDPLPGDSTVPVESRTQVVHRMAKTGGTVEEIATIPGVVPILHVLVDATGRYLVGAGGGVVKLRD